MQYLVPSGLPIPESTKAVVEILDELLFKGLGVHFLEPIAVQTTVRKVIPKLISHRKVSIQAPTSVKGISSNLPLSNKVVLSAD